MDEFSVMSLAQDVRHEGMCSVRLSKMHIVTCCTLRRGQVTDLVNKVSVGLLYVLFLLKRKSQFVRPYNVHYLELSHDEQRHHTTYTEELKKLAT